MDKRCFYCDMVGHVNADCRKKKDDEERKTTLTQNSLASSHSTTAPPGLANVPTNSSMASTSSLRQLTVPSHVTDDDFHSPMRIFALNASSPTDRVMVDSGAAHSACPSDDVSEHEVREVQHKIQFQTASGELLERHGEKVVPYMTQDTVMGITYQVTDVEGPVAAVSSMNDVGMAVLFSPQGAWVCDEVHQKPADSIDLKWEKRTFWLDLPRVGIGGVQRVMALRREQPVEQVEKIREAQCLRRRGRRRRLVQIQSCRTTRKPQLGGPESLRQVPQAKSWTDTSSRTLCFVPDAGTACRTGPRKILIVEWQRMRAGLPKVVLDWMFFTSDQEPGVQLPVLVV